MKVNLKKNLRPRIQGWFPQEPHLPTMRVENKPKKIFTKTNILIIAAGLTIVMLVSGAFFFAILINFPSINNQPQEARSTVEAYINALNNYNASAAWNLMSPNMQSSYRTAQNFSESFVAQLQASGWHARVVSNTFEYGTIAEWILVPTQNSAHVNAYLEITRNNASQNIEAFNFVLKTYGFRNYQPIDWRIESNFTGE